MVALPLGEVGVLDRQLRQLRARGRRKRAVALVELREQQTGREVVGAHVVEDDQQQILVGPRGARVRRAAGRRPGGERRPASSPSSLGARLRLVARERAQVGDGQLERRGASLLDRGAVDEAEAGAEDLVPVDDDARTRAAASRRPASPERARA